ncbi:hypothetical protein HMPREF9370_2277 [Neisseria wadsworthii 9715]|uniref:Uncharacterized protein n=1 Tax=Neisseria wadsworthii 9715 TaxID=1030841 RepID=G4CT67_9NEIS|nr:hypothetical protein HMPREF9370_2277 [Neisseria wadsworthii 9715]
MFIIYGFQTGIGGIICPSEKLLHLSLIVAKIAFALCLVIK